MKRIFLALALACASLTSCNVLPKTEPTIVKGIGKIVDIHAGEGDAMKLMWPFALCGVVSMFAGIFVLWKTGNWKVLAAGMAVGLAPAVFMLFAKPLVPWVAVFALIYGILTLIRYAYKVYDEIEDDIKSERKDAPSV